MEKESKAHLEKALKASKAKGNEPLSEAVVEALEDIHRRDVLAKDA